MHKHSPDYTRKKQTHTHTHTCQQVLSTSFFAGDITEKMNSASFGHCEYLKAGEKLPSLIMVVTKTEK